MTLPHWLTAFFPAWEQAAWVIVAGAAGVQAWKKWREHRDGRKPRGYVIATFAMAITSSLGILVVYADARDPIAALAGGLKVGLAAPLLWWVGIGAARRFAPWLAAALGEERRCLPRYGTAPWNDEERARYRRATKDLFGDTDRFSRTDIQRARRDEKEWRDG